MVKYRGGGLLVFLEPFCKSSSRLSNIFFLTPMFTALISVYDSTFVGNRIFVLWSHEEAFDGLPSFKVNLYPKPTNKYQNKLINLLKTIMAEGGINNITNKRLYPTGAGSPKYYGLPKIHKTGVPLRPIVSSRGSATYETEKELAKILKPLVGRSPHHVQNNKDFLDSIKNIKIKPDECIMSYDVSALFTSISMEPAIKIIQKYLEEDKDLSSRTSMTVKHITCLLDFCLKNTYFHFKAGFMNKQKGLPWVLPQAQ